MDNYINKSTRTAILAALQDSIQEGRRSIVLSNVPMGIASKSVKKICAAWFPASLLAYSLGIDNEKEIFFVEEVALYSKMEKKPFGHKNEIMKAAVAMLADDSHSHDVSFQKTGAKLLQKFMATDMCFFQSETGTVPLSIKAPQIKVPVRSKRFRQSVLLLILSVVRSEGFKEESKLRLIIDQKSFDFMEMLTGDGLIHDRFRRIMNSCITSNCEIVLVSDQEYELLDNKKVDTKEVIRSYLLSCATVVALFTPLLF